MNRLRRVINNTIISFFGQVVTWTATLLLTIAYGRFLGAAKFGELYFAITFVSLITIPLDAGYSNQIIRSVAQEPEKALHYFSNIFFIKLLVWPIVYALTLLFSWLLGYPMEVRILVGIGGFIMLSSTIASTFAALHYALERTIYPAVGLILEKGSTALFSILLLRSGAGVQTMALIMLAGSLMSMVWQAIWFFRLEGVKFVIDPVLIRAIVRTNIPFLIFAFLLMGYTNIDTVLLSLMTNNAIVGWYGAGTRFFDTLNFLPNIVISAVMYPIFSKLSLDSDASLKMAVEKTVNFLLLFGMPISIGLIVTAPNIISFLYHRVEFAHTIPVLQLLAPGLIFIYITFALSSLILSKKQDKKLPLMAMIALLFNLVLNLILIPRFQHIGAAITNTLTELLVCCIAVVFIPRYLLPFGSLRIAFKTLVASLVMALAILPLLHVFSIFVLLPIAILVYFTAATLLSTIPREDCLAVYSALRRKVELDSPTISTLQEQVIPIRSELVEENMSDIEVQ